MDIYSNVEGDVSISFNFENNESNINMKPKTAIRLLLSIVIALAIFHIGILLTIIPEGIIWGGRLGSTREMYLFESITIAVTLYLILILLIRGSFIRPIFTRKVTTISLWFFLILFVLNSLGNVLAKTTIEQLFAIPTLAISVLLWIVLRQKD